MSWVGWPKGCRKCGGDLSRRWEPVEGHYVACIQCGTTADAAYQSARMASLSRNLDNHSSGRLAGNAAAPRN